MEKINADEGTLVFAPEATAPESGPLRPGWKLLIVDDDPGIHEVTRLALDDFEFDGRRLEFLDAYSSGEAERVLHDHRDVAVALVDVVMESEHAGLDLIRSIRETHHNKLIRLILRTGQPGQAPERAVIRGYDINDYKEKAELSAQKLYSTLLTSLRSWRDLTALEANRAGLRRVIDATGRLFPSRELHSFVQGVLEQLVALLFLDQDALFIKLDDDVQATRGATCDSLALEGEAGRMTIVAGTGQFSGLVGEALQSSLSDPMVQRVSEVLSTRRPVRTPDEYWGYFRTHSGKDNVIFLRCPRPLSDDDLDLIELFLRNVSIAYENNLLYQEINATPRHVADLLGESRETAAPEAGQQVRRVAEYCFRIALGLGFDEREAGILCAAVIVAGQHRERWGGDVDPQSLDGSAFDLSARIAAVADAFDALHQGRSGKQPWTIERIAGYLSVQRGRPFDPLVVDWVLEHLDQMIGVATSFSAGA